MNVPDNIEHKVFFATIITRGPQIRLIVFLKPIVVIDPHQLKDKECKVK